MSGAWAREADAAQVSEWADDHRLPEAEAALRTLHKRGGAE